MSFGCLAGVAPDEPGCEAVGQGAAFGDGAPPPMVPASDTRSVAADPNSGGRNMNRSVVALLAGLIALCSVSSCAGPESDVGVAGPVPYVYAVRDTMELEAHVFLPPEQGAPAAGIVIFHGGGWSIGEPEWGFPSARRFAERGMVAVSAQYRLSDEETITPIEAMADARDAIRWMRENADELGVDKDRIAAYGWSAGAHLAVCTAIFDGGESTPSDGSSPDALVLESPAVSVAGDGWFQRMLGDRADAGEFSPDEHVRAGLPPTLILQGDVDTVTPLAGAARFCERMREAGNVCELEVYEGYGHLFTPAGIPDDGVPEPDRQVKALAMARADEFLGSLGFMEADTISEKKRDRPSD